ncbi:MAG: nitrous oxide reductase family maturation protein NosD, partial [Cyclobacteriaceae bacterium]|nr:nitrous oxide reductase family maturation protein NosD [Cyclobacteriaceae bacterium]
FLLFLWTTCGLAADTLTVGTGHIPSIQAALDMAAPHDFIMVIGDQIYPGNIRIEKPVHLIGSKDPVIDGNAQFTGIMVDSDSVEIDGFLIRNVGMSYTKDLAGIWLEEVSHCIVSNNKLKNTFFGIYLKKSGDCWISGNEMITRSDNEVNSGNGIHLWDCENVLVENNFIAGHRDGIYFEFVENSKVIGNISEHNLRYGLHFMFSNFDIYERNTFRENGTGVAVMFSKNITMHDNLFVDNWGSSSYGLLFKEIYDGELTGNVFMGNTMGLYADGSNRILISGNEFIRNGWAINILGNCTDNTIARNNFIGNTFDVTTDTKNDKNNFAGNYWDQYAGYDLDKDGVGDVPFRPMKLFSYVIARVPEAIILLRSLLIDVINYAEKVAPAITPAELKDESPAMKKFVYD